MVEAIVYKDREPFLGIDRGVQVSDDLTTRNIRNCIKIMQILGLNEDQEITDEAVERLRRLNGDDKSEDQ